MTPVAYAKSRGVLGPKTILGHCILDTHSWPHWHMVGHPAAIGMMHRRFGFSSMMEETIDHMGGLTLGDVDGPDVEWRVAIRDMGVEGGGRIGPLVRIDCAEHLDAPAQGKVPAIRTRRRPPTEMRRERLALLGGGDAGESGGIGLLPGMPASRYAARVLALISEGRSRLIASSPGSWG